MARFSKIKEDAAPKPLRQSGRLAARMREYERHVTEVGRGEVGKLVPEQGESPRGLALRIGRAARRLNRTAETWVVDDVLYFKVI